MIRAAIDAATATAGNRTNAMTIPEVEGMIDGAKGSTTTTMRATTSIGDGERDAASADARETSSWGTTASTVLDRDLLQSASRDDGGMDGHVHVLVLARVHGGVPGGGPDRSQQRHLTAKTSTMASDQSPASGDGGDGMSGTSAKATVAAEVCCCCCYGCDECTTAQAARPGARDGQSSETGARAGTTTWSYPLALSWGSNCCWNGPGYVRWVAAAPSALVAIASGGCKSVRARTRTSQAGGGGDVHAAVAGGGDGRAPSAGDGEGGVRFADSHGAHFLGDGWGHDRCGLVHDHAAGGEGDFRPLLDTSHGHRSLQSRAKRDDETSWAS